MRMVFFIPSSTLNHCMDMVLPAVDSGYRRSGTGPAAIVVVSIALLPHPLLFSSGASIRTEKAGVKILLAFL
jgi:hypothetical protein